MTAPTAAAASTASLPAPPPWAAALVALPLFLPLFVHVAPGGGLGLGESNLYILKSPGADLPLSFFVGPVLALAALRLLGAPARATLPMQLAAVYAVVQLVAVGVGALVVGVTFTSFVFVYQALVPLVWLVVGDRLATVDARTRDRFLVAATAVPVAAAAVYVAATFAGGAVDPRIGVVDALGPFVNSKSQRYFPTVLIVSAWYLFERGLADRAAGAPDRNARVIGVGALVVAATYAVLGHSRSTYLMFAAFVAAVVVARARRDLAATAVALLGASAIAVAGATYVATADQLPRSLERWTGADETASVSSDRHWDALTGGIVEGASLPLGRMYSADVAENLAGVQRGTAQIANSESQFSEAALRAGPLGVLPLLALTAAGTVAAIGGLLRTRPDRWVERWAFTAFLVLWPLSGLVQLNLTEAYVAPLAWLAAGLAFRLAATEGSTR